MKIKQTIPAILIAITFSCGILAAEKKPTIAVTDLAYTANVAEYFDVTRSKSKSSVNANEHVVVASSSSEFESAAGNSIKIEQKELSGFTNDIKGKIIKGGTFALLQPKRFDRGDPVATKSEQVLQQIKTGKTTQQSRQPEVEDVVARIKKGEFNGANYVLFGTLSDINYRNELFPIQGTENATSKVSLDLTANFSLINTKSYEIVAAFSAMGSSNETRLLSKRGDQVVTNKGKLIRDTSRSLANDVYSQLMDQLGMADSAQDPAPTEAAPQPMPHEPIKGEVTRIR